MMVIAMIIVSNTSIQSLFYNVNANVSSSHPGYGSQLNKFPHPHGTAFVISSIILKTIAKNVKTAHAIPRLPILFAIVSSLY